ncbi:MAG TPA: DUF3592 domain-containing protein [Chloroflexi bacterium]|nr:DUF3592 domain-containing protein [Chloroflexota bacterium]
MAFLISLGIGTCLLGAAVLVRTLIAWRQGRGMENWPAVQGTVSKVFATSGEGSQMSEPVVAFAYEVDGQRYTGTGVVTRSVAPGQRYEVGTAIEIFYNPAVPQQSVLRRPDGFTRWGMPAFGAVLVILGVVIAAWSVWGPV